MSASISRRSHLVERAADAARSAIADDARRHLVERAADAARMAVADETSLTRAARPPLAPVEAIPAVVETAVAPPTHSQVPSLLGHNEPVPVTRARLRRAGLIDKWAMRGRRSRWFASRCCAASRPRRRPRGGSRGW